MSEKTQKKKSNARNAVIIVGAMVVVTAGIVYFGINAVRNSRKAENSVSVSLPIITTKLERPADGKEVDLQTLFTVLVPQEDRGEVSDSLLEETLAEIMQELDVEKLLSVEERVDYINTNATELLNERLTDGGIETRVIVTDISSSKYAKLSDPTHRSEEVAEGLFENLD